MLITVVIVHLTGEQANRLPHVPPRGTPLILEPTATWLSILADTSAGFGEVCCTVLQFFRASTHRHGMPGSSTSPRVQKNMFPASRLKNVGHTHEWIRSWDKLERSQLTRDVAREDNSEIAPPKSVAACGVSSYRIPAKPKARRMSSEGDCHVSPIFDQHSGAN